MFRLTLMREKLTAMKQKFRVIKARIEKLKHIDAVVISTNTNMVAAGETNKSIYKKAGIKLNEVCSTLAPIIIANPVVTAGFELRYKYIVHVVAPRAKEVDAESLLEKCYQNSIIEAVKAGAKSIAFPVIGIRHLGWQMETGVSIAINAIMKCDQDLIDHLECIYLVTPYEEVFFEAIRIAYENRISVEDHKLRVGADINNIDYTSVINYFSSKIKIDVGGIKIDVSKISDITEVVSTDNKAALCCSIINKAANSYIREEIEKALYKKGIYISVNKLQVNPVDNGVHLVLDIANLNYVDVITFIKRNVTKSSNVYKNQLVPLVLDAFDELVDDDIKAELLCNILNNLTNEVIDEVVKEIEKKTKMKFVLRMLTCVKL